MRDSLVVRCAVSASGASIIIAPDRKAPLGAA